jgi:cysteine sulfinate desulfinase/cysteine desulfurase-like protein
MIKPIYLDYNATTPHDPEVIAAVLSWRAKHEIGSPFFAPVPETS